MSKSQARVLAMYSFGMVIAQTCGQTLVSAEIALLLAACRRNRHFANKSGHMKQNWPVILAKKAPANVF